MLTYKNILMLTYKTIGDLGRHQKERKIGRR